MSIAPHLVHYAHDQLSVVGGWRAVRYVNECLAMWEKQFGAAVVTDVRKQISKRMREEDKR